MKKITILLMLFVIQITIAQENKTLDDLLNNGDPTRLLQKGNSQIIYQRSATITGLPNFNNKVNTATHAYFEQALSELFNASNKQAFINYSVLRGLVAKDEEIKNIVSIGIINAEYDVLNYDQENAANPNNGFQLTSDKLIPIQGKQQFIKTHTTVISPLKKYVEGTNISFLFNKNLIFSESSKNINTLHVDVGDGIFKTVISNGVISIPKIDISVSDSRDLKQTYQITYSNNTTLTTYSTLYVKTPSTLLQKGVNTADFTVTSDYTFKGYDEPVALKGVLDYRVFYANASKTLKKPIIILDGFDPGDTRKIQKEDYPIYDPKKDKSIYQLMSYKNSKEEEENLVQNLRDEGYDVIIVNFPSNKVAKPWTVTNSVTIRRTIRDRFIDGGADYVERNALTVVTLLKKLNNEITTNGSSEKLIVMGPSMGGLISRYALAYMEKNAIPHNTRLWLSMDSPHLGANIPISIQSLAYLMKEADIVEAADTYNYSLKSPAAQQMLINQHKAGSSYHVLDNSYMNGRVTEQGFSTNSGSPFYQLFYKALYNNGLPGSKGYPIKVDRKIAMINGSLAGEKIGTNSQQTINVRGFFNICLLWWCFDMHAFSAETYTLPAYNTGNSRIARFKKAFNDKTTIASSYDSRGNLDILSGGLFDGYNQIVSPIIGKQNLTHTFGFKLFSPVYNLWDIISGQTNSTTFSVRTNTKNNSFIPTFSSLAIKDPNRNWSLPITQNLVCSKQTPFDTYYGEENNTAHVSFTQKSKDWLFKEIMGNPQGPSVHTRPFTIQGDNTICYTEYKTFTIDNSISSCQGATQWTVSNNLTITSQTNNSITVIPVNSTVNGLGLISAKREGGNTVFDDKGIWVGKPLDQFAHFRLVGSSQIFSKQWSRLDGLSEFLIPEFEQDLYTFNYEWNIPNSHIRYSDNNRIANIAPYNTGTINIGLRLKNRCGCSNWNTKQFNVVYQNGGNTNTGGGALISIGNN